VKALSIGITTRHRPRAIEACLRSIVPILGPGHDVLVFDDGSAQPVEPIARAIRELDVRVFRVEEPRGTPAGRNRLVREARHPDVLLLDDDTRLLDRDAIARGVHVLTHDPRVGAIAFAQAEADGSPWPEKMQPARANSACVIPAFIGFAHLVRRELFLAMGGYQERLGFYGEEKEYCLRLLARGLVVVYLPDALVAHVPDPGGRDPRRYVRQAIRNDCLASLYNEPLPMAIATLPLRLARHRRMARGLPDGDPGGLWWIVQELFREWPALARRRRSVGWRVMREWRRLKQAPPYQPPRRPGSSA
jgi:glycosyltransferase involved in cell wall biosynthesis